MRDSDEVTSSYLLYGYWYALEQAGRFLHDAVSLYETGRHSTALGGAMLGQEEFGKARLLLKQWREVACGGKRVTLGEVRALCHSHQAKQKSAVVSVMQRFALNSVLGRAMRTRIHSKPDSPEFEKACGVEETAHNAKAARMPDDRFKLRGRALYVDPNDDGSGWNRPVGISNLTVTEEIADFAGDYSRHHRDITERLLDADYPGLSKALSAWTDKPELPPPRWPSGV